MVRRVQGDAPKDLYLVTREEQARFIAAKGAFKPLHQVMKEENVPFDGGKLQRGLRRGQGRFGQVLVVRSMTGIYDS